MIDETQFQDFVENRKDIKKPMTALAIKKLRTKLERLEAQGYCPNQIIERSIINGWQDVYPHDSCKKSQQGFISRITDTSWASGLHRIK
jgi:hypothetical protein